MSTTGIVFNIQRFSIHDGPGIRTTIFLKGCPLHCFWCHNPEGIRPTIEILFHPSRCIGCGECLNVCPEGVHVVENGAHVLLRERCVACGRCAETCYAEALELSGREMPADEVVQEVLRDRAFYENSGGGVTLSGGEPLLQRAFSHAILARCKDEGLHTALETVAHCRWEDLATLLPLTDLVLMDIKHMDAKVHRAATGVSNEHALVNARRLMDTDRPVTFRVPIVPTVNDTPEAIDAIAAFVCRLADLRSAHSHATGDSAPAPTLELLRFHRMATEKYHSLGLDYRAAELEGPAPDRMEALRDVARARGVTVVSK